MDVSWSDPVRLSDREFDPVTHQPIPEPDEQYFVNPFTHQPVEDWFEQPVPVTPEMYGPSVIFTEYDPDCPDDD